MLTEQVLAADGLTRKDKPNYKDLSVRYSLQIFPIIWRVSPQSFYAF